MLPQVFQALKASSAVRAIVGSNPPRIWRHGLAPQDTSKPYVTWQLIVGTPENNLSDPPPCDRVAIQVDCWYQDKPNGDAGVVTLAVAVRDALEPLGHMTGVIIDTFETETRLYRMAMQFDIFTGRH